VHCEVGKLSIKSSTLTATFQDDQDFIMSMMVRRHPKSRWKHRAIHEETAFTLHDSLAPCAAALGLLDEFFG